ncbi:MAG: class I SAM-dependent DNA methyltransferase [Selenomonadaceae bacterium]|nr:class I SAM-dependent DNA methyltransferase [Selenomonadaceae bacterium]
MNVKEFVNQWREVSGERANYQKFWLTLIRDVFNIDKPENFIQFEVPVKLKHKSFIDGYFPDSKVIIEQKNFGVDLEKEITQSDGTKLTPYEQARRYIVGLPLSMHPKKIITCNFSEFLIYDMETLEPPVKILLEELPTKYHLLDFLINPAENKIRLEKELSLEAGKIVAKIYNELLKTLAPGSDEKNLNILCVRIIFCLYAESVDIFGKHKIFRDYLQGEKNIRRALRELFEVLNTPIEKRSPYLDDALKNFPYVNGGLFADEIDFPNFTPELRELLLEEASSNFNWEGISPTIFGTVFESTLNPDNRRAGGMHYTDVENIHKVIDPLFLNDLRQEFNAIKNKKQLRDFQDKLAAIKIFDPACGSGNFLTESYLSLRRLENEVLKELLGSQIQLGELDDPIKVSIQNFYGIEINDFAVTVAKTSMWIAELKMKKETAALVHKDLKNFPLKEFKNIHEGNALHVDWKELFSIPNSSFHIPNYIISNPPFIGASMMTAAQKADAVKIFGKIKLSNSIDYVGAWYHLAAKFMQGTKIKAAFVSTNSITQGEQVAPLWKKVLDDYGMQIIFAHQTFKWDSESTDKAAVHCVVIGIADKNLPVDKKIFNGEKVYPAKNINPYLVDAPTVFIESRAKHIQPFVPRISHGNKPTDGGNFIFSADEANKFIKKYPAQKHLIHRYLVAKDFLHGEPIRYCLWLFNVPPNEYSGNREIMRRLEAIRVFRLASSSLTTQKSAETPYKFFSTPQTNENYLCIPQVSSERRKYIPIGFMPPDIIAGDRVLIIPSAQIYHFGILTSSIHMAWMRAVAGRLEMRYNYSGSVVYNNFIWAEPTPAQKALIEKSAKNILDVRAKYQGSREVGKQGNSNKNSTSLLRSFPNSLADLYDELTMPADLRKAHRANDKAIAAAYGFENILDDEPAIVAELMKLYEALTS